jgi:hypothetical protein
MLMLLLLQRVVLHLGYMPEKTGIQKRVDAVVGDRSMGERWWERVRTSSFERRRSGGRGSSGEMNGEGRDVGSRRGRRAEVKGRRRGWGDEVRLLSRARM